MDLIDFFILFIIFITSSHWAYCSIFYERGLLRYSVGFLKFTNLYWILTLINLLWFLGWKIGLLVFILCILGGVMLIANFTTNQIYRILKISPDWSLAIYSLSIWIFLILTIIKAFL